MPQEKLPDERRHDVYIHAKAPRRTRHGKYGYRGYGSGFGRGTEDYGGAVIWGRGFAGVGSPGAYGEGTLPRAGFFTAEVWGRGPHAGLGPKGYSRSDERIREEICDELTRRPDLDPSQVVVSVERGEVMLEGLVEDLYARNLVDDIASGFAGVRQVHNLLRVEEAQDGSSRNRSVARNAPGPGGNRSPGVVGRERR